jgi:hypothetical protein
MGQHWPGPTQLAGHPWAGGPWLNRGQVTGEPWRRRRRPILAIPGGEAVGAGRGGRRRGVEPIWGVSERGSSPERFVP